MKEELSIEKLKSVKLWITAGPREKFTASEVTCAHNTTFLHLINKYIPVNSGSLVFLRFYKDNVVSSNVLPG